MSEYYNEIMDSICSSSLVYFVLPDFCGFPCANYFAFNERSVGWFGQNRDKLKQYLSVNKRFIVVSNSAGENFEKALLQQANSAPEILYMKSAKYGSKSNDLIRFLEKSIQ